MLWAGGYTLAMVHFFEKKNFPPKWGGVPISRFSGKGGCRFLGTEVYNCQEVGRCPVFRDLTVDFYPNVSITKQVGRRWRIYNEGESKAMPSHTDARAHLP